MMNRTSRPIFIVFEGLDGVGKSTCARRTAEALDAVYMTTPCAALRARRPAILEALGGCQEAHQLFYLSTVCSASCQVRERLAAGRPVVLDRYFLSTQAYATFRGSRLNLDSLGAELLQAADLTVLLEAPLEVRRARVRDRGHATCADDETLTPEADARLRAEHLSRAHLPVVGQLLRLDTSQASPRALVAQVMQAAREMTGA